MKNTGKIVKGFIPPILIFLAWWYVTYDHKVPTIILPGIPSVIDAFRVNLTNGQLFADLSVSLERVFKGYSISVVLGVTIGTLVGMSRNFDQIISPTFHALRAIPIIGWLPLIIIWCGIGEMSKIVIIILGSFFPIFMNTVNGMTQTPKSYVEVAHLGNMSPLRIFLKVYLPSATPHIFVGLRLGLGIAWMALVASELLAANTGIGFRIADARIKLNTEIVIMGMIVIGIIGVIMDKALTTVAKHFTRWADTAGT